MFKFLGRIILKIKEKRSDKLIKKYGYIVIGHRIKYCTSDIKPFIDIQDIKSLEV